MSARAQGVAELSALLGRARRVLAFTGAGISTKSGIPDFRGPKGVWQTRTPTYYQDFIASERARCEYWEFKLESWHVFRDARPNAVHLALVALERLGRLEALVTQNVDGLHQAAGTSEAKLIELHGTNSLVECIGCGKREPPERSMQDFEKSRRPPRCLGCDGLMKPAVVMFGQALVPEHLERAREAAESADLILALGSSLVVTPAANIPLFGAQRGTPYVIVNQGETPHDEIATLRIDDDVGSVLVPAVQGL
jgi:NAD-dependent protein deacetylase/lipoamidase